MVEGKYSQHSSLQPGYPGDEQQKIHIVSDRGNFFIQTFIDTSCTKTQALNFECLNEEISTGSAHSVHDR